MASEKVLSYSSQWFRHCKVLLRRMDWKLAILLGLPLLLIALNDSWLFSYVVRNYIDPWVYFGYFLDLKQHLNTFEGTYYGTRLPWILPGFLAYKIFQPLTAAYVLHLVFYYAAIISLYLIVKQTIGRRAALLTAILMGCYYFFLESIGNDYVDGAGLTYLLLTLLMLTNKEMTRYFSLRLCLAGVFYGCLIYTQLFLITYTPLIVLYYLFVNREHNYLLLKPLLRLFGLGFIGLTLFLCITNYSLNGTFFFFFPIVKWTVGFVLQVNPWWSSISNWWIKALWLLVPAITFLGSILILTFHRITESLKNRKSILFFQVYFILNVLMYIVLELGARQPVLNLSYYTSYMLPAMFLALGSQLAIVINQLSRQRFYLLLGSVIVASLSAYILSIDIRWVEYFHGYLMWLPIVFGMVGFIAIISQYRYCKEFGVLFIAISLAMVNLSATRCWKLTGHDSAFQKSAFLAVIESAQATQSMDPQENSRFWYNCHQPFGSIYRSVSSTYLWGYRLFNEDFPELTSSFQSYQPTQNDRLFILSDEKDVVEKANQHLAQIGLTCEFLNEKDICQGPVNYKITYLKIDLLDKDSQSAHKINKER